MSGLLDGIHFVSYLWGIVVLLASAYLVLRLAYAMSGAANKDTRPRLLDLFCGAGGAAMGYHRAGFDVVGVDIKPQPHYPFEFIRDDGMVFLPTLLESTQRWGNPQRFDAIHASPPCQAFTDLKDMHIA